MSYISLTKIQGLHQPHSAGVVQSWSLGGLWFPFSLCIHAIPVLTAEFGQTWQWKQHILHLHTSPGSTSHVTLLYAGPPHRDVQSVHTSQEITSVSLLCLNKSRYFPQPRWVNYKILIYSLFTPQLWVLCIIFTGKTMNNSSSFINNLDCLSAANWHPAHRSVSCSIAPHPSQIMLLKWM